MPQSQALFKSRQALAHRFWLYFLGAVALLTVGLVTTDDRHATVKLIGKWLIGITVAHLVVLWIVPVVILPAVTTNPWAHLVAAVAHAVGAGIVTSLVVLALVGVVFLFVDHFIPAAEDSGRRGLQLGRASVRLHGEQLLDALVELLLVGDVHIEVGGAGRCRLPLQSALLIEHCGAAAAEHRERVRDVTDREQQCGRVPVAVLDRPAPEQVLVDDPHRVVRGRLRAQRPADPGGDPVEAVDPGDRRGPRSDVGSSHDDGGAAARSSF